MPLPSQSARSSSSGRSNSNMYRKRRSPKPLLIAGGIMLLVAFSGWMLLGRGGSDGGTAADSGEGGSGLNLGPQSANAAPPEIQSPLSRPAPQPRTVQQPDAPAPFELRQGRPDPSPNSLNSTRPAPRETSTPAGAATSTPSIESSREAPSNAAPAPSRTPAPSSTPSFGSGGKQGAGLSLAAARERQSTGDPVAARVLYTRALAESESAAEQSAIRAELTRLNEDLVFSPRIAPDDPWVLSYTVQGGDSLSRISQRQGLAADWRLIQRINGMNNPNRLKVGQRLKLLRGPFHAVVTKSSFRLDLYMGPGDRPEQWLFIRSFPVGLGEGGSTPLGTFVVKRNSKLVNPHWINPRTGESFDADNPLNPIGEHWIGLEGVGDSVGYAGYGLHGTIDPSSIGREMSMGCVRMSDADIELIYELLGEEVSVVRVEP